MKRARKIGGMDGGEILGEAQINPYIFRTRSQRPLVDCRDVRRSGRRERRQRLFTNECQQ